MKSSANIPHLLPFHAIDRRNGFVRPNSIWSRIENTQIEVLFRVISSSFKGRGSPSIAWFKMVILKVIWVKWTLFIGSENEFRLKFRIRLTLTSGQFTPTFELFDFWKRNYGAIRRNCWTCINVRCDAKGNHVWHDSKSKWLWMWWIGIWYHIGKKKCVIAGANYCIIHRYLLTIYS